MKRKPWPIILIALFHVLAPFGNIIFNSLRADRTLIQTWNFWYYALPKPLFITYVILPPLAGIFIFICKRWSYWCYVVCLSFIFFSNVYGFWTNMNLLNFLALALVMIIDLLVVAYFVTPSVRVVYFDPRMRWWETAPRYNFNLNGLMGGHPGFIKNISAGGALVESGSSYSEGESVELSWDYENVSYAMLGKIVYQKPLKPPYACGVKFDHDAKSKKTMKSLVKRLHKEGKMTQDRIPGPEDSFFAWVKKLATNKQGLFPERKKY